MRRRRWSLAALVTVALIGAGCSNGSAENGNTGTGTASSFGTTSSGAHKSRWSAPRWPILPARASPKPRRWVLADAGYWHRVQMQRLMGDGLQELIPPDASKRKGQRPGWQGRALRVHATRSDPSRGPPYARRQGMIEPVFAHTKFNRRCDRFLRRGRSACRSEWRLIHATHSLLKLHKHTTAHRPPDQPPGAPAGETMSDAALRHGPTPTSSAATRQPPRIPTLSLRSSRLRWACNDDRCLRR
jgi:hypothetical protein